MPSLIWSSSRTAAHTPQSRTDWGEAADRLLERYQRTGRLDRLAEAITTLRRQAETTLTEGGQREPAVFYRLVGALWTASSAPAARPI